MAEADLHLGLFEFACSDIPGETSLAGIPFHIKDFDKFRDALAYGLAFDTGLLVPDRIIMQLLAFLFATGCNS